MTQPRIVGLGGTTRPGSSSELALRLALKSIEEQGAAVEAFVGPDLVLPIYAPECAERSGAAQRLISAIRGSHGIVISSPGYHGSISGLLKNALDYVEDTRDDPLPYFDGRAVGCIACASGWQATGSTLATMRSIVHSLRGWPTPMAVAINTSGAVFAPDGNCADASLAKQFETLAAQIVEFARMRLAFRE
jgi:FMN reductase